MINVSLDWLSQYAILFMLVSLRLLGFFLTMPLFAFQASPLTLRVALALLITVTVLPLLSAQLPELGRSQPGYFAAMTELLIGMAAGFMVRLGFLAFDLLAEVLSVQAGLSFASSFNRDPALLSGLTGEFLGLTSLALAFAMNVHLLVLDLILQSFQVVPFGTWVSAWQPGAFLDLIRTAFVVGLVLSLPVIVVYLLFNITQAVLVRVSPQLNLFAIGFAILVPLAYVVIALLLPIFPEAVERALEGPIQLIRSGLTPPR